MNDSGPPPAPNGMGMITMCGTFPAHLESNLQ